jgi:glycosyltransferase involved in cell wall biosynthesis
MTAVSVVIPAYNRGAYLRESIESVRRQTVKDVEILVVDDASRDGALDALKTDPLFADVRLLRHEANRGPGESRRTGILAAKGKYVAFLDDDDLFEPDLLEKALSVLERDPSVGLFCCDGLLVDGTGAALPGARTFNGVHAAIHGYPLRTGPRSLAQVFLWPTVGIGFVARKDVFERVSYPPDRRLEDYRFQLDVAGSGFQVYYLHEPLARYRMHGGNASGASPTMCQEMVTCLESARGRYPSLRDLGWRARRRVAQARMDFGISCIRAGERVRGAAALGRAVADYPAQALVLIRFASGWLFRQSAQHRP